MGSYERGKGLGNVGRVLAEHNRHAAVAVIDDVSREGDDLGQGLRVEQQEKPGYSVGERLTTTGEELIDPGKALILAERRAMSCLSMVDDDLWC